MDLQTPDVATLDAAAAERRLRQDLAACYRLVALYGWEDLIFTHISARVPGPEHHFLINPYGMMFHEITASSLVKVDQEGRKVEPSPYEINPAGFVIHSAIHQAREDAQCVLHVHSVNGVAVSAQEEGCCRCRSTRCSCWRRWPTTTTRAWRWRTTRSRAWCATSAGAAS